MKINTHIIILLIGISACNQDNTNNQATEQNKSETVIFPEFKPQFSNKGTLDVTDKRDPKFELDSSQYSSWTDKYTPFKTDQNRIYSSELYSVQPQLDRFAVLTIRTDADHWFKLHLITINENLELIDQVTVSDSWAELLEQAGDTEIVGKRYMYTSMLSNKEYRRIDVRTTEVINYYSDSTTYEIDSITTQIELSNKGTFELTQIDSIRSIKYSGIE